MLVKPEAVVSGSRRRATSLPGRRLMSRPRRSLRAEDPVKTNCASPRAIGGTQWTGKAVCPPVDTCLTDGGSLNQRRASACQGSYNPRFRS